MEGISFIFLSYLRCENIIQILEFLCIEYNIRMEFWKIDQTPRIDLLVNYFPVILISYRNRKGIIEVIPIFSILQPEAFAELNFCLQIPSGVRLFVFFFFFDEIVESTVIEVSFNWNTRYHRGSLYKCDKMYKQNLDSKIETSKKKQQFPIQCNI